MIAKNKRSQTTHARPVRRELALAILLITSGLPFADVQASAAGAGEEVEFNSAFLIGAQGVDLERFSRGTSVDPGTYLLDIEVNGTRLARREVTFLAEEGSAQAKPCLTADVLALADLKPSLLAGVAEQADACVDLESRVPGANVDYVVSELNLVLSIPHAALNGSPRGHVPVALLDHGASTAFVNYNLGLRRSQNGTDLSASVNSGMNLGAWRIRHRGAWRHNGEVSSYQRVATYAERALPKWGSRLLIGESSTRGDLFDSVAFTGVDFSNDDRMLPDALRGYAPVVRGNARTDAKVVIRQNGFVVYDIDVAPGPFEIDDLYPTNYSGDLEVTVEEADGGKQKFTVAFSAVPLALRKGSTRFEFVAGQLRDPYLAANDTRFAQASWARGLSNRWTLMGGAQTGRHYAAVVAGGALNTAWGAFGADVTVSRADLLGGQRVGGTSMRLNYQRHIASSGTNFGIAAYRYSTSGYLTLAEAAALNAAGNGIEDLVRARHRVQIDFSQRIGERSTFFARGGYASYWANAGQSSDYQIGFQSGFRSVNYSFTAQRVTDQYGRRDDSVQLSFSLPLGRGERAPLFHGSTQHARDGQLTQLDLNGRAGERLNYHAGVAHDEAGTSYRVGAHYRTSVGDFSAAYANSAGNGQVTASAAGAIVAHRQGINFAPPLGETFAIVQAPGATGARLGSGVSRIAGNGVGIVSQLSPYRWNEVKLDPNGIPLDVELLQTAQRVAPTAGSAVFVHFPTRTDANIFIQASTADGQPLSPFGAQVRDDSGEVVGMVGQGGLIQIRGQLEGRLQVEGEDGSCVLQYAAPAEADADGLRWIEARCEPAGLQSAGLAR